MEQFADLFKLLGLDPALWGVALLLAFVLRYARGMLHWVGEAWTFGAAVGLGVLGAVLKMSAHEPWRVTVFNALALLATVLVLQYALGKLAEKVPFIPKDNEWLQQGGK